MASVALETLRRLRKKGETVSTPKPSRPPLRAVERPETVPSIVGGTKDEPFEVRLVPLEELTKLDRLVIRLTFGTDRTE